MLCIMSVSALFCGLCQETIHVHGINALHPKGCSDTDLVTCEIIKNFSVAFI